ncbi:Ig-like domain-containing protein [Microbacterium luticocti]|uniref:Ig-like domain-containing protein n=1 Tax=Microbacterium luticocti TaxID=451764 RepID=UPI00042A521E|nr:Ig-like domain-containing protein [Microbacterium luticocti]
MRFAAWLRARPKTLAAAGVVTAGAVAITTLAFVYRGNPTAQLDLNDGSVWITKQSALMVGHFNDSSRVLDGGLSTSTDKYDILQSGQTVIMHDEAGNAVSSVDPATVALTGSTNVPAGAQVVLGGSTVAVVDPAKGSLWVVPAAGIAGFKAAGTKPTASLGAGAVATVATDGTVFAVSPAKRSLVTVRVDAQGAPTGTDTRSLEKLTGPVTVAAVGDTPVVLDARGTLLTGSGLHTTVPAGSVLQQPSAAADAVTVASESALLRVPFDGSEVRSRDAGGSGAPAAPVWLNGCAYAAWGASARFVRDCTGTADDLARDIPGLPATAQLTFRQNRDVVVLNDVIGGSAWMASDKLQQVDNWDDLNPDKGQTEDDQEQVTEETIQSTLPKRTPQNTTPIANPDAYGIRPGRTTVLPVLENDTDADGDVLTVTVPKGNPRLGQLERINNGSGLQIVVPADASGSDSFTYQVDDGRPNGTATAKVSLRVHPWSVNEAPKQTRVTSLEVEAGGVLSYNVLPDWRDPDGDSIYLSGAEPAPGDEVEVTSDGRITYRATSGTLGRKDVKIHVSDGTKTATGTIRLDVRPRGATEPIATADHVIARVGRAITVSPLVNDLSAGSQELRLTRVENVDGATVTPDFANKTFRFISSSPGTYYVQYLIAAGTATAEGIVRIDVQPDTPTDDPPVAVQDVALLPAGGDTLVNVLANDSDPGGGILVVQSVSVPPDAGVSVAVQGHETLRVSDQGTLKGQLTIGYTISNGTHSADGEVVVIPVPAPSTIRPPVAEDDQAVVRAGDVVTIPVLENDSDPNGGRLHVAPDLVPPLVDAKDGEAFVSQDEVRFKAGTTPGTAYLTYEAVDASGQKDAGYVTVQILPVSVKTNQAPRPKDLTARVLSGSQVRIQIPLDGIDPDGDSVELTGIASAPGKGRIAQVGDDYIDYEAIGDDTGADTFTYRVRDRLGREGIGTVRVGIAPAASENQPPYAVKDTVVMRPGRQVAVPVLTNDSDPEGDRIGLVTDGIVLPKVAGLDATVQGDRVVVTAPSQPVQTSLQYTIQDARGARAVGVVQVSVRPDVPLLRPIARDDRVQPEDIVDGSAVVDVLGNDEDPDGTVDALTLSIDGSTAQVLGDGKARIRLTDEDQLLTYTITDRDGLTASAFIRAPALGSLPPALASTKPVTVKSGETIELPLADYVRTAGGKPAVITETEKVSAVHGNGDGLVKDRTTLVYTSAKRYYGPDALTFEVTDGAGPDDAAGHKATLVLPITVTPPDNEPPTFTNGQLKVAPGEDAAGIDLRALTTDPDPGDLAGMRYRIAGDVPAGLSARVDGQSLQVAADASTPKGTAATIPIEVSDGHTEPVRGSVAVSVTASTRPLPTANDDVIEQADQGKTIRVDVLDNDVNPFPDTPLKITAAVVEAGDGTAEIAGDHLQITPANHFVGRMTVRYRIQDATRDRDREVEGHVVVTVQGVPAAPGTPTVSSVQDRTVVLSWTPPVDNGAPITKYTVSATSGGYSKVCQATTCTLDGLTNNVEYNFRVVATNRVGDSPASPPSETARPDARPDTPQPPTLKYGDRSLKVTWTTPPTPGSPVESFNLEISPAPPSGIAQKTKVTGNSLTWTGLENGTAYQVRVQAVNRAPEPSSWSAWSATEIPARAPDAPGKPATAMLEPVGDQAQMRVTWTAPNDNGDAVSQYQLDVMRGSSVLNSITVGGTTRSQAVRVDTSTSDYTFRVRAQNKAGWGTWSPVSAPRRGVTAPGQPGAPKATPGDRQIAVSYTAAAGHGATSGEIRYQYSLNGGAWQGSWSGTRGTITGLTNGTDYKVRVRAVSTVDGTTYPGGASAASAAAVPFGKPGTPGASASASGQTITYHWSAPDANGAAIDQTQIRIDGGAWQTKSASGSTSGNYGFSQRHTIEVRAHNKAGWSAVASASATTAAPPQPTAIVSRGAYHTSSTCTSSTCAYFKVTVSNFTAGDYQVYCNATGPYGGTPFAGGATWHFPANGTVQLGCYFGGPGQQVWVTIGGKDYQRSTW